jgi:phosphatidylglycerol:prolipoprotein diacylglycerol transferase
MQILPLLINYPNIDPILIEVGPLAIRWYSLAYICGILIGFYYILSLIKKTTLWGNQSPPLSQENIDDFLLWATLGVVLGGRLGHVLFYDFNYYLHHPLEIFAVWQGGMAFHGGALGVLIAAILFTRQKGLSFFSLMDLVSTASCIGLFFGRIANFINGELWGRPTNVDWAMVFPTADAQPRHPSQLYEAALEGLLLFIILNILIFGFKKLRQPGFIAGTWLIGYAIARIFSEFYRVPDYVLSTFLGDWLSIGMALSIPMILIGLWSIFTSKQRIKH